MLTYLVERIFQSAANVRLVDRAVQYQVNHQLRRVWHTPAVTFDSPSAQVASPTSWLIDLLPTSSVMYGLFNSANGFHLELSPVYIEIAAHTRVMPMSLILSHEVIEALVDPTGERMTNGVVTEICDPVEQPGYRVNGVTVSNFVTPRWFIRAAARGRFDFEALLTHNHSA